MAFMRIVLPLRAENIAGHRMRIHQQREAEPMASVMKGNICLGDKQQAGRDLAAAGRGLLGEGRARRIEDRAIAAELHRYDDDRGEHEDIDHDVFDEGDHGRRAQSAAIGVERQDDEGDGERQMAMRPSPWKPRAAITRSMPTSCSAI